MIEFSINGVCFVSPLAQIRGVINGERKSMKDLLHEVLGHLYDDMDEKDETRIFHVSP